MGCTCSSEIYRPKDEHIINKFKVPQLMEADESIQYEELTKTIQYKNKFSIQEEVLTIYNSELLGQDTASTKESTENQYQFSNQIITQTKHYNIAIEAISFKSFAKYQQSISLFEQLCEQNSILDSISEFIPYKYPIGQGAQGSVELNFINLRIKNSSMSDSVQSTLLPIASKYISDRSQFIRESIIFKKIDIKLKPKLAFVDEVNQKINMEVCICTLQELKDFIQNSPHMYLSTCTPDNLKISNSPLDQIDNSTHLNIESQTLNTDIFYSQLLLILMQKVNQLLLQNIFHGDIKPSNIALALRNQETDIIFLDFGSASWDRSDFYNSYTPAFSNPIAFSYVSNGQLLDGDQIRFSEFFSACRTVQYMMIKSEDKTIFRYQNIGHFITKYQELYPKTISIMTPFFFVNQDSMTNLQFLSFLGQQKLIFSFPIQLNKERIFAQSSVFAKI